MPNVRYKPRRKPPLSRMILFTGSTPPAGYIIPTPPAGIPPTRFELEDLEASAAAPPTTDTDPASSEANMELHFSGGRESFYDFNDLVLWSHASRMGAK